MTQPNNLKLREDRETRQKTKPIKYNQRKIQVTTNDDDIGIERNINIKNRKDAPTNPNDREVRKMKQRSTDLCTY